MLEPGLASCRSPQDRVLMTDHQQIRRDAEEVDRLSSNWPRLLTHDLARHCLALLDELDLTKRQREEFRGLYHHFQDAAEKVQAELEQADSDLWLAEKALSEKKVKLEQAERHFKRVIEERGYWHEKLQAAEARLAKVPLLIEALKQGVNALDSLLADIANDLPFDQEDYDQGDAARAEIETALAAWEDE
jgi:chromosome segregation ATPase